MITTKVAADRAPQPKHSEVPQPKRIQVVLWASWSMNTSSDIDVAHMASGT
ncbi:hypothetical protein [Nocardia xishanensis]|uniref:hypothetical protein n=1 Tax=Nocardia xishanensis TaxID=238964 RepID=UPI0033F232FE